MSAPDVIVANARIATGDPRRPWATAIAISSGKLAAIGSAAEILKTAGAATRLFDLAGREIDLRGAVVGAAVRLADRTQDDDEVISIHIGENS